MRTPGKTFRSHQEGVYPDTSTTKTAKMEADRQNSERQSAQKAQPTLIVTKEHCKILRTEAD